MTIDWRNSNVKVAAALAGITVLLVTSVPQTPEELTRYLSEHGYSGIDVGAPVRCDGKNMRGFAFEAVSPEGLPTAGKVCMGNYWWSYRVIAHPAS